MIGIPQSVRILISTTPIDMRKSIDGLTAIVQQELEEDAYSGHLFIFVSRRRDRVKILAWDKGGFVLVYKRLERGQFKLPHMDPSTMAVEIDATQLAMLLDGIDSAASGGPITGSPHPRWIIQADAPWTSPLRRDLPSSVSGDDHRCAWRERAEALEVELAHLRAEHAETLEQLAAVQATIEKLQRHVFGKRSEMMPPVAKAIRDPARAEAERLASLQTRRENAEKKRQLVTRPVEHKVPEEKKVCPKCGGREFTTIGGGRETVLYELVPAIVERQLHVQEKCRCRCGETIITAEGPAKVFDKTRFGPTFMALVAVSKCADSLPLYRQAMAYRRVGVQVDDSTLGDLFHRTAEIVNPLYERLLKLVPEKEIVLADETTQRVQAKGKTRTAWLWSFIGRDELEAELIAYVFANSRSGETPVKVLGETVSGTGSARAGV